MRDRVIARLVSIALLLGLATSARANGRLPATVNVQCAAGDENFILLPATFGLLLSRDGGQSFQWVCEEAIGYGGTYDPDYAISAAGWIYATTFAGLRVSKDGGCTFETLTTPFQNKWVGEIDFSSDGRLWATTSTGGTTNDVFVSDDGQSFSSVGLEASDTWWLSLKAAPGQAGRLWVAGYKPAQPNIPATARLVRTDDGGKHWKELPVSDFKLQPTSQIYLEAVANSDPDLVFARVFRAKEPEGDALYRSLDGGETWTQVLEMPRTIRAVLLRGDDKTLLAGSDLPCAGDDPKVQKGCVMIAHDVDHPATPKFVATASQPKMACLTERPDGTLLACGSNWEPDRFGLGVSSDGASWEPIMRFADIAGPLECGAATVQSTSCARIQWPSLCEQLGLCGEDGILMQPPKKSGGCGISARGAAPMWLFGAALLALGLRRRRRR